MENGEFFNVGGVYDESGKQHMTVNEIIAVCRFLGDKMTTEQAERLMDEARLLSVSDREWLLFATDVPPAFYTELSMHDGEMGGLNRY